MISLFKKCLLTGLLVTIAFSSGSTKAQEIQPGSWEAHFGNVPQPGSTNQSVTAKSVRHGKLTTHGPEIGAAFESVTGWLTGYPVSGGQTFNNSIALSSDFYGSSLEHDDYVEVEIRFSNSDTTLCQTFRTDLGYAASGVGVFPGSAWDISDPENPRRLNICFAESNAPYLTWNPNSTGLGGQEYVYIMESDYDGTGLTYAGSNGGSSGAENLGIYYFWWPKLTSGHSLLESEPATLTISPLWVGRLIGLPQNEGMALAWTYHHEAAGFNVYGGTSSPPSTLLASLGPDDRRYLHDGLVNGEIYYYRVEAVDSTGEFQDGSIELQATPEVMGENMSLLNSWHGAGSYGDIWGYTDETGHEYALICARNEGVSIIDIDVNPAVEVGFIPSIQPERDAKDVKIYDHYAIIVKEYEPLQVVDLTDVTNPVEVSIIVPAGNGSHNCMVDGDYLYVVGNHEEGGLEIFDLTDPYFPAKVGEYQAYYYHDIDIHGNLMAAAAIYGQGIDILDISDKTNPYAIRQFDYAGSGAHNVEFSADGLYLFVGDEIGTENHTRVFDVDALGWGVPVANIIVDPNAVTHNCYQKDGLLYIAHYTEGLRVWDVTDPTVPTEIAYYDTYQPSHYGYSGAWSVYPYFESGKIIVSDMSSGLFVIGLDVEWPPCCGIYTEGFSGNSDCSPDGSRNLADISRLIDHVYISKADLCCAGNGNVDGSSDAGINLADITRMIDHVYISKIETAACQ